MPVRMCLVAFGRMLASVLDLEQLQLRPRRSQSTKMGAELGVRDQDVNAGIGQDEMHLVCLKEVVDRDNDPTQFQDAEESRDELRTILQPKTHAVSRFYPIGVLQSLGEQHRLRPKFGVGIL